jgi:hypothetical protein
MSSVDVDAAEPTETQLAIERFALNQLRRADAETIANTPFLFNAMRLTVTPNGTLRRMTEQEYVNALPPAEQANYKNFNLQLQRQQLALEGKLPISEGMRQAKEDEFRLFKEQQNRMGNTIIGDMPETAIAQTTAGQQGLRQLATKWRVAEDAERRAEIQTGQANILGQQSMMSNLRQKDVEQLSSLPSRHLLALGAYGQQSGLLNTASIYDSLTRANQLSGYMNLAGTVGTPIVTGLLRKYKII